MRLLCSIKNKNKQIKVKIPKLEVFIHKCYIEVAVNFGLTLIYLMKI